MKYYLIAGEASGDLHASHLMRALRERDAQAQFRFFGGDNMSAATSGCGERVKHYKELAYMGFIPVLMHLPTILQNMSRCKKDIMAWQPDIVILVDYAGFNLSIAKYLRQVRVNLETSDNNTWRGPAIYYYISPKIWAWKEYRIKNFKRDIDEMFSILPFEKQFFEDKHHYPIHYVGNPTADEVRTFRNAYKESYSEFCQRNQLDATKPIIALLCGSRRQEIKDNLPTMLMATRGMDGYQRVIAGAPGIEREYYERFTKRTNARLLAYQPLGKETGVEGGSSTYSLLSQSTVALVTSGTATLETCLFDIPQVVCYKTPVPKLCRWGFNHILKVKYISLVNLIADREVVPELFADRFGKEQIEECLHNILPGKEGHERMLSEYRIVRERLGEDCAPENAARIMTSPLPTSP